MGILSWIMKQKDKAWHMQLLNGFFDYVQGECKRNPDLNLTGLLNQIELLKRGRPMSSNRPPPSTAFASHRPL